MKHSELKPLVAIASLNKLTPYDVLITLIESAVKIYTINSSSKKIAYDYIEASHYHDDGNDDELRVDIVAPGIEEKSYAHGEIIPVGKDILFDLAVNKRASETQLFCSDDQQHMMSSKSVRDNIFNQMTYEDLYIHKDDLDNATKLFKPEPNKRSPRRKKPHILAIIEAYKNLSAGAGATASDVFSYIKQLTKNGMYDFDIEFEGTDIRPYDNALPSDSVMLVEGKTITKKRFQTICSEVKKKK
jgi:hypothetical protein